MQKIALALAVILWMAVVATARAEDAFVQIEARPSEAQATESATAFAATFPNVRGYRLKSGWRAIVLGPYTPEEAARQLTLLKREGMIPRDSFVATTGELGPQFWPTPGQESTAVVDAETTDGAPPLTTLPTAGDPVPPARTAATTPTTLPATIPPPGADETPDEARQSESLLTAEQRIELQRAMQFFGTYDGALDGAFGRGTRSAMAAWQEHEGHPATGILTTFERRQIVADWKSALASLGLERVTEIEAGIAIDLPLGLVSFGGYEPPFVRYDAKDGSGYQVFLISRRGDGRTLGEIAGRLAGLGGMPGKLRQTGDAKTLVLAGEDDRNAVFATARLDQGLVKGYAVRWPKTDAARAARVLAAMKSSFAPQGTDALGDDMGVPSAVTGSALLAGIDPAGPQRTQSGVFVTPDGSVLTVQGAVRDCGTITIDGRHPAQLVFEDDALGIAVVRPASPLAPRAIARIAATVPRTGGTVTFAGYSYGGELSAPVVTTGSFRAPEDLDGDAGLVRLSARALPGDAGAAVLDASGAMLGLLIADDGQTGRTLPADVAFARPAGRLASALAAHGVTLEQAALAPSLAPEDLSALARNMTTLVTCWK